MTHDLEKLQRKGTKPTPDRYIVDDPWHRPATPAVGGERDKIWRIVVDIMVGHLGHSYPMLADRIADALAAPPASPLRGRGTCIECGKCVPCDEDCPNYFGEGVASPPEQPAARGHIQRSASAGADGPFTFLPCPFCGSDPKRAMGDRAVIYCASDDCFGPRTTADYLIDAIEQWNRRAAASPEQPAAAPVAEWQTMNLAPKDKEIIGQDTDGRIFNLRWDPDDCGENWYDVHGDQMAHPVRWMPMPAEETK